jgi:hypothetical protein
VPRLVFGPLFVAALVGVASSVFGQADSQTIDALFPDFATDQSPGCVIGAARGGVPLAARAYGMADLEHGVPHRGSRHCDTSSTDRAAVPPELAEALAGVFFSPELDATYRSLSRPVP